MGQTAISSGFGVPEDFWQVASCSGVLRLRGEFPGESPSSSSDLGLRCGRMCSPYVSRASCLKILRYFLKSGENCPYSESRRTASVSLLPKLLSARDEALGDGGRERAEAWVVRSAPPGEEPEISG